jgi:hypothetical protein
MVDELTNYEKLIEGVNRFAMLMRSYFSALIEQGFSEDQAINLTAQYQRDMLNMAKPHNSGESK